MELKRGSDGEMRRVDVDVDDRVVVGAVVINGCG